MKKRNLIFLVFIATAMLALGFFDAKNLDNFLYQYLRIGSLSYYDLPIWGLFTAVGTISAVVVALYASYKSTQHVERQLKIEQEPYVVAKNGISIEGIDGPSTDRKKDYLKLSLKNIGRGPAIRITVTGMLNDPNKSLFEDKKDPHSYDLGSNDEKIDWKIDENNLKELVKKRYNIEITQLNKDQPIYLYIFFSDQLNKNYQTKVKLFRSGSGDFLKVMENKKDETL